MYAVVQPRKPAHHPPSSLRCVSVRPQQSPSLRAFTTEMAAKVCRSVLLLSRSSGAVAGSLPALVVSSQRHHQHLRPVSPRTSEAARRERGVGTELAGWTGEKTAGLAKEVKLTSACMFSSCYFIEIGLRVKVRHMMSHDTFRKLEDRGYSNPRRDAEL